MKWELLFDSSAALRILPNFGDRLVYSPTQHAFLCIYRRRCLAGARRLFRVLLMGKVA